MDRQEYSNFIVQEIESNLGDSYQVEADKIISGEFILKMISKNSALRLVIKFRLSKDGMAPSGIAPLIYINRLESFIKPIVLIHGLDYSLENEHSIVYSTSNKALYGEITRKEHGDIELKNLSAEYLTSNIIPFFKSRSTIEGLGDYVLQHDFDNIINIGLGGEYPVNVLKAITIAKWCGNETKYQEYTKGLQVWIDEDRNDPNYAKMCDAYQGALDELKSKLESQT